MTPGMVDSLHEDVIRMGKLVEDLHSLSMADSEALTMVTSQVPPLQILQETLKGFLVKLEQQQISLKFSAECEDDLMLSGNKDTLIRLFSNLIENTLRYTDSPGCLDISAFTDGQWLNISFQDSPPGVPEDSLTKIFNRLYRVDTSRSREFGGSGLGLSICRKIVENHKGVITGELSHLGGLNITLQLPLFSSI